MTRFTLFSLLPVALVACGGMPQAEPSGPAMTEPMKTSSSGALGSCTTASGTRCSNDAGVCLGSTLSPTIVECVAVAAPSTPCRPGTYSAEYLEGVRVCLQLCTSVRDCAKNYFCNTTVLADERGTARSVSVCMPGLMNRAGQACTAQAGCETGATDLTCVGATPDSPGICTKSCTKTSECQLPSEPLPTSVCSINALGQGTCRATCQTDFECGGGVCDNNVCLPKSIASGAFPTPGAGQVGGSCTMNNQCGSGRFCMTSSPGGRCTGGCTQNSECGSVGVCVDMTGRGQAAFCEAKCAAPGTRSNCRAGYTCSALSNVSYGFCTPL